MTEGMGNRSRCGDYGRPLGKHFKINYTKTKWLYECERVEGLASSTAAGRFDPCVTWRPYVSGTIINFGPDATVVAYVLSMSLRVLTGAIWLFKTGWYDIRSLRECCPWCNWELGFAETPDPVRSRISTWSPLLVYYLAPSKARITVFTVIDKFSQS